MDVANLLEALRGLGVNLAVEDDKLKVTHSRIGLPDDLRHAIVAHKTALLEILAPCPQRHLDAGAATAADRQDARPRYGPPLPYIDGRGRERTVRIMLCPSCGVSNWGPKPGDPQTWHCLTCAGSRPRHASDTNDRGCDVCPECGSLVVVYDQLGLVCVTCRARLEQRRPERGESG